jgi:hypothetical protein
MKYLIIRDEHGLETPVFCLAPKTHEQMATAWRRDANSRVVSAGFCEIFPTLPDEMPRVRTFGFSSSLNIGPRPQDARIIAGFYKLTVEMGEKTQPSATDVALHRAL